MLTVKISETEYHVFDVTNFKIGEIRRTEFKTWQFTPCENMDLKIDGTMTRFIMDKLIALRDSENDTEN